MGRRAGAPEGVKCAPHPLIPPTGGATASLPHMPGMSRDGGGLRGSVPPGCPAGTQRQAGTRSALSSSEALTLGGAGSSVSTSSTAPTAPPRREEEPPLLPSRAPCKALYRTPSAARTCGSAAGPAPVQRPCRGGWTGARAGLGPQESGG